MKGLGVYSTDENFQNYGINCLDHLDRKEVRIPKKANFSLPHRVQTGSGAHKVSYPMSTGSCFSGLKQPRRENNYSPLPTAEVRNEWRNAFTPPIRLHGVVLS
jgi:hypothetical protein